MLFLHACTYDSTSRILSAVYSSASASTRVTYEYRDVPGYLYQEMLEARPHWQRVLEKEIAPTYAVRRAGQTTWQETPRAQVPDREHAGV